jgi:23S rRNA pseudouridine1911/1915/1917 synthase
VVGDTLYGAPHHVGQAPNSRSLDRNFLHAARLAFQHPRTRKAIAFEAPLPSQLAELLGVLRAG